jgi:type I restriction-modification system DNA methylase subunit
MGRLKDKSARSINAIEMKTHKTERSGVAVLMHWMREIIERKQLDLGMPDVETGAADRKMPDAVIYESRRSQNVLCVIEAKPPYYYDVFYEELTDDARKKANNRNAPYFVTTNFKKLIWWNTERANDPTKKEEEKIVNNYTLSELENLDDIEQTRYRESIKRGLDEFLTKLYAVHTNKEAEPKLAVDEFLIFRLQEKIRVLSAYYKRIIDDQCHKDPDVFAPKLKKWFVDQGWSFAWQPQDFDKAGRQTAYLLVNKILFYNLLQTKRPQELAPLEISEGVFKASQLQKWLQVYFDDILKIDYETIYTTDFIDNMAFPEAKEVVQEIKGLIKVLREYDFSTLGYDVIGRIFERLIPREERHNLGQYFTSPDVVDLILRFCMHHEDDKILDPSCGAGTFLVRAYQHKKLMNQRLEHEKILDTLWGNDIAKFPAHLATINLAINDLGVDKNYPNILENDFFELMVGNEGFDPEKWRKARAKTLGLKEREVQYPRWFDAMVGNPPYTKQQEIAKISPDVAEYKKKLIERALLDLKDKKIAEIGEQAGIYVYFFVHGIKFLKDGGHFGFIVSNSWLDVKYGKGLQEFLLKNYKIIAIIESKVERWFEEADINTCIIILQKCKDPKERENNLVRFVYLKKPLRHFIPPALDMWEKQVERLKYIDQLKKTILAHSHLYENDELRIFPKSQKELWEEGYDLEERKFVGAKWGKYLRAPDIYFGILNKCKNKFRPLKEVAEVRRGLTTGANEFFYLKEEGINKKEIEKKFWMHKDEKESWIPNYLAESPSDIEGYMVNPNKLKKRVLLIHLKKEKLRNKKILNHILSGERKKFHIRDTCKQNGQRKSGKWYDLDEISANLMWPEYTRDRLAAFYSEPPVFINNRLYGVYTKEPLLMGGILNSTVVHLISESSGPQPGGGGGPKAIRVYDLESMYVPYHNISKFRGKIEKAFTSLLKRDIHTIFSEIGASSTEEVSLNNVQPDRRELDKIIMGDILGLTEEEQLEVYRAVVDLVKSRIEKARSFGKRTKTKEGIDMEALKKSVVERLKREAKP